MVRDQGTTVPVVVNGRALGKGRDHPLIAGDELRIAGYTLRVEGVRRATRTSRPTTPRRSCARARCCPGRRTAQPVATEPHLDRHRSRRRRRADPVPEARLRLPHSARPPAPAPRRRRRRATAPAPRTPRRTDRAAGGAACAAPACATSTIPGGLTPNSWKTSAPSCARRCAALLDLLPARAHAKREVRADATIIVAQRQQSAQVRARPRRGRRASADAARAGLHGAAAQPRRRAREPALAPGGLRRRHARRARRRARALRSRASSRRACSQSSPGGSLLPMNHKAKLWNLYEELYGADLARGGDRLPLPVRRGVPARVSGKDAPARDPRSDVDAT